MWREYAEKFFKLMSENFFVSIEDLGLSDEEVSTLKEDITQFIKEQDERIKEYGRQGTTLVKQEPPTLGLQLMHNIVLEIIKEMREKHEVIKEHAPEKNDDFFIKEFNRLPVHERHFLIMWLYQRHVTGVPQYIKINSGAFDEDLFLRSMQKK